jgi:hypothetical protein
MLNFDSRLKELYQNKPELLIDLPPWLLSSQKINEFKSMRQLAIVQIAGRDSVAAAVKSVGEEGFTDLLPVYIYTGTEYGPWSSVEEAVRRLSSCLPETRIHDLLVFGSPRFWKALNGRFITELMSRYGFYTPCIGCHLYLHSVRIPLALTLGKIPIISGERERHNGMVKINQISEALVVYQNLAEDFGIRLLLPLRHVVQGDHIDDILGFKWPEGKEQLSCVLSRNYRQLDGSLNIPAGQVKRYLEEFALPCAEKIIASYTAGRIPNHLKIATRILGC